MALATFEVRESPSGPVRTLTVPDLPPNSVNTAAIQDGAVTGAKLANASVDSNKIAAPGIINSNLGDDSVNARTILDGSVTAAKLAAGVLPRKVVEKGPYAGGLLAIVQDGTFNDISTPAGVNPSLANPSAAKLYSVRADFDLKLEGGVTGGTTLGGLNIALKITTDAGELTLAISQANLAAAAGADSFRHVTLVLPPTLGGDLGITTGAVPISVKACVGFNDFPAGMTLSVESHPTAGTMVIELLEE